MENKFQAVVIGGGPGGYVCAIRLAQLGIKTACIESRGSLGGTCLNIGCIPSKSLLNLSEEFHKVKNLSNKGIDIGDVKLNLSKMMKNKDKAVSILTKGVEFLLKKNNVTYFKGTGSFKSKNEISIKDDNQKETLIKTDKVIIATGSVPVSLPGIEFDENVIVSSTGALELKKVPKKMIVVGGGYIGLEMGSVWSRLGAEVHVVEFLDHITPGMDKEISKEFHTVILSDVPVIDSDDEARRFISFIDECYDRKVKLIISAAELPEKLYVKSRLEEKFKRTISRMTEMQSKDYLSQAHLA